jgi:hypothetical protein
MNPPVRSPAMNSFAHPADAAGRNLNSRERGDGRRLEPGPRRRRLLRRGRSGRLLHRLAQRRSGRDRLLRQLRCGFRAAPFLHRAKGFARARVRTAHMECGHRARRPTRDRARWRAGAAAKLHEVRFELAYANVRQWVSLIVADLSTGKWAVPGAYSENGDNCQMQLRRRVRTH